MVCLALDMIRGYCYRLMAVSLAECLGLHCPGPCAQEANTGDSKQTCINKSKLKKASPAKIYRGLPGWAENT